MFITLFVLGLKTSRFLRFIHCHTKITTVQQRVAARSCEGLLMTYVFCMHESQVNGRGKCVLYWLISY